MGPYHTDGHTYRLQLGGHGQDQPREIEFDARASDVALGMTYQLCGSRPVTLFEDGRKLADLEYVRGFWKIS